MNFTFGRAERSESAFRVLHAVYEKLRKGFLGCSMRSIAMGYEHPALHRPTQHLRVQTLDLNIWKDNTLTLRVLHD